jgi:hypothetical protein
VSFCCPLVVVGSLAGGTQRWDSCPTSQVSFLQLRPQARALCVCVCVCVCVCTPYLRVREMGGGHQRGSREE